MTEVLRLGGRVATGDGRTITWSVAEGVRGRRWREAVTAADGRLEGSLLLEASMAGRPTRLEMTTAAGLLTLHPELDEASIHGNLVTPGGIHHLAFAWGPDHELLVLDSLATEAVGLASLAGSMSIGESRSVPMLRIDHGLEPRAVSWTVERAAALDWVLRAEFGDEERHVSLRPDGLVDLPDLETWPLELG